MEAIVKETSFISIFIFARDKVNPVVMSNYETGKHSDSVWRVVWAEDDIDRYRNFYSCSADGRVIQWTVVQTRLRHSGLYQFLGPGKDTESDDVVNDGATVMSICPSNKVDIS